MNITVPVQPMHYQTAPLDAYSELLRNRAMDLFHLVERRLGAGRVRENKGSFSVLTEPGRATAAKIVIYEDGKGSLAPQYAGLQDGIYIWVRVPCDTSAPTVAVAPRYDERFAYFRLAETQELHEIADFLAACSARAI